MFRDPLRVDPTHGNQPSSHRHEARVPTAPEGSEAILLFFSFA